MPDNSNTASGVREGDVLAGKYRIDGVLGTGGMGVVVAAHHLQLDERVALKFLIPAAINNPEAMARFAWEARATAKIKSEHVARVSDVGTLENGAPYIVMEFLEGRDLGAWLRETGRLPIAQAVEFVLQGCEAIAEAHSFGIIHRDLKPANLFVVHRNDGLHSVKVLDFGISKMTHGGCDLAGTSAQAVMGSPYYMSPEQMRSSKDVTPQSDVWSIGITLYELIAGQSPFSGDTFSEVWMRIAEQAPPPLRSLRPETPSSLEAVIFKCLEKDRARRFQNVAQLASALRDFAPKRAYPLVERIVSIVRRAADADIARACANADPSRDSAVTGTMDPCGRTTANFGNRKKSATAVIGVAGALFITLGAVLSYRGAPPRSEAHATPLVAVAEASTRDVHPAPRASATAPVLKAVPPTPSGPPTAPATPLSLAPPSPSPDAQAVHRPEHEGAPRKAMTSPPLRRPPTVDCNPPFYFEESGIRVFKKECVR